ncbi:hypothetical protein [Streptomyces sp. NPDC059753]|uniref:hypothetical protein n=1 Tax=Streptomyces sp. NPDC059753 TaxID=3346933 RepID=UPI0036559E45
MRRTVRNTVVRNLTVDGLHTYFVLAGETPILAHNAGECPVDGLRHGDLGEGATLQRLHSEGYKSITREVRFKNSKGDVFRADFVAQDLWYMGSNRGENRQGSAADRKSVAGIC